ncbi:hypothetical protein HDU81_007314 [Chytriomyces hyalinus]|nr:hypothetical protein HDU81_007314 [Chytriomyces hyalinus]
MSLAKVVRSFLRSSVGISIGRSKPEAKAAAAAEPLATVPDDADPRFNCLAWGSGMDGKLGHGHSDFRTLRTNPNIAYFAGSRLRSVAVGASHSAAIVEELLPDGLAVAGSSALSSPKTIGTLYGWGSNFYGQAGFATTDQKMGSASFFTSDDSDDLDSVEVPCKLKLLVPQGITVDMRKVACGDFHSAALASDGTLWTWGAGCLGRKDELYDSNAILVDFFPNRNRSVVDVKAAGTLTVALAQPSTTSAESSSQSTEPESREVYMWGYFLDPSPSSSQLLRKSTSPLLIADALELNAVTHIAASSQCFAIVGKKKDSEASIVRVYGPFWSVKEGTDFEMPMYPTFHEMQNVDQIYEHAPVLELGIPAGVVAKDVHLFRDLGLIVREDGVVEAFLAQDAASAKAASLRKVELFNCTKPVDQISCNNFGMLVVFKGGEARFWGFMNAAEVVEEQESLSKTRGLDVLRIVESVEAEVVLSEGAQAGASGWDHALVFQGGPEEDK